MKKRLLALVLAVMMLISVFAACSGDDKSSSKAQESTASKPEASSAVSSDAPDSGDVNTDDIYEVVMIIPTLGAEPAGIADVENAINAITGPEIGVNVSLYPIFVSDLTSQTNMMMQSGDKLDLAMIFISGVGEYVSKEALLELDDLMAEYGSDIERAEGVALSGGYYDGKLYAIPSEEKHARSYGFFARTDMVEELGMSFSPDEMYSTDDLEELFSAYKAKYGDGYYCIAGTSATTDFYGQMNAIDSLGSSTSTGVLIDGGLGGNTTVVNLFGTPEYEEYAQMMYRWAQAGYYSTDASTNTDAGTVQIQSGYYLGSFNGTETDMTSNLSRDCGYPMTAINLVEPYASTSMYMVSMWGIPVNCENPGKTFKFLNMLYGDNELANILTNGLEGVTYEVVEKGERPGQMCVKYAEGVDAANAPYIMPLHVFGDKLNIAVFEPMTLDYYEMAGEFNSSLPDSRKSISLGYVFNSSPVSTQRAAVEAVVQQYVGIVSSGAQNPDTVLPQFREALTAAGIDEIIAENQAQFDNWFSEQ